jgi:hypothetical protein
MSHLRARYNGLRSAPVAAIERLCAVRDHELPIAGYPLLIWRNHGNPALMDFSA